jgi:hypothetical protein
MATAHQLGAFTKGHPAALIKSIIGTVMCAGAGIFFLAIGLLADTSSIVFILVTLLFFGIAAVLIYKIIQSADQKVYLFQQGMVIERKGQLQAFPWNQTAEVFQSITRHYRNGIYTGTTYRYTLRRVDGYQLKLDNMTKGIAELGQAVAQGVAQALVPRALQSIQAGQTLTFAQFSINAQGIGNGRETIPWQQVEAVNVNRGQISIQKAGKFFNWGSAPVSKIPNFLVFIALSQEMIRQTRNPQRGYGPTR